MRYTTNRRQRGSGTRQCSIGGCATAEQLRRGLCHKHYERLRVYGSTTDVGPSFAEGFWAKVAKGAPDECWPWHGASVQGYGVYGRTDKSGFHRSRRAPRISYELAHLVQIPAGVFVLHTCDNPPCVNPAHLYTGTPARNLKDAFSRGRLARDEVSGKMVAGPNL